MIIGIDAHNVRGNGGSLIHLKELLAHTDPLEHKFEKIIVWVLEDTWKKLPKHQFIEYILLPKRNFLSTLFWQKNTLEKEAKEKKCSILFFPGGIYLGSFMPFIAFSQSLLPFDHKIRKMYWKTSLFPKLLLKEIMMKHTFNKADGIIFVSKAMKDKVEEVMNTKFLNSTVIHHGVSEIFKPKIERTKEFSKDTKIRLLTVSSHALHKNLVSLVLAVGELKKANYNVQLKIVGPYTKYGSKQLLNTVKKTDPTQQFIHIIGDVEYEKLPKYYYDADIFVFPSLCESFGLPLLEAYRAQLTIMSYNNIEFMNSKYYFIAQFKEKTLLEIINNFNKNDRIDADKNINDFNWRSAINETTNFIENKQKENYV